VRWVDLLEHPARLEVELAKAGATPAFLVRDLMDVPELQKELKFLRSEAARLRRALEWFGDEGNPQPANRTRRATMAFGDGEVVLGPVTPKWGPLPRLDVDERHKRVGTRRGGRPTGSVVETETFWAVLEMGLDGMSARAITRATDDRSDLAFVNRDKVAIILRAVAKNRKSAQRALDGRKIPPGFSATPNGVSLPGPERV
jgi:hypothetical protein